MIQQYLRVVGDMKEARLGRTGLKVKTIGFGGIPIQRVSEREAIKVVRRSFELGIDYYDTARGYSVSEERIGKALHDVRDKVFFATKSLERTKKGVLGELEISLKNLKTDWIDVYQLHSISTHEAWEQVSAQNGALHALYEARDEGKIRHLGITSHNASVLQEILETNNIFETIMIPYNYISTIAAEKLLPLCKKMDIGTVIMKPFGGGVFSSPKVSLKYVLANKNVDIVIPGMFNPIEVEENIATASGSYHLNAEERSIIKKDRIRLGREFCRTCDYCQPCPQEIPISLVLCAESFLRRMGGTPKFEELLQKAREKVPTCTECGECESRCPYHLPIRKLLPEKMAYLEKHKETA